ncbi:hypothetical protein CANMA_000813 [Candida margitis]|uniref:uncharacterized protein n=1 Tax=Candida margitis TaxID=1775924 RepID=UPI002225C12A|nr:uncharacterized protein CANMA_000813 [Candida margitis]KAI5970201.1 hypothetical protein CANMA_000813 [Candida margitis]
MSHIFVNHSTTLSTFESTSLEPTFKDLPPLESTTRALSIFGENFNNYEPSKKRHQHHHNHNHRRAQARSRDRTRPTSSASSLKSKVLPTRTISRGLFKGYNDIRRFNCFSEECNLNIDAFRNCAYCRHIPYIPSPLKDVELNPPKRGREYSDDKDIDRCGNNKFDDDDEYDAFNDYLCQWKSIEQQNINKIKVPQGVGFIAPRERSTNKQQFTSHPSRAISNTLSTRQNTSVANKQRNCSHEQHPTKVFNALCNSNKDEKNCKSYGMIDLLKCTDFQFKQRFADMKNQGKQMAKARSISAPSFNL